MAALSGSENVPRTAFATATAPLGAARCTVAFNGTVPPEESTSVPDKVGPAPERTIAGVMFPSAAIVTRERLA